MIITKTPFRISFFGGGTDYPGWYEKNGGSVLSTTINKYCYISCRDLPPFFKYRHRIVYSKAEQVNDIDRIKHPSVRECLRFIKMKNGLEIHHDGDLPAKTGLGSSSSFTVGLINALYGLKGVMKTKRDLALDAIHIEQNLIKEHVGSQDQTAAAFGGLNKINFGGHDVIHIQPVIANPKRIDLLQAPLMLFYTGISRYASDIAKTQIRNIKKTDAELRDLNQITNAGFSLINGTAPLEDFGRLIGKNWELKRKLSSKISNTRIDAIYDAAIAAGATGGKLLGAGGGGFMLFFAKPESQALIRERLKKLLYVPFRFETHGSQVIYFNHSEQHPDNQNHVK